MDTQTAGNRKMLFGMKDNLSIYIILIVSWIYSKLWNQVNGLMSRVFANGPGDWGSIPGRVLPKSQKMVLEDALLNTQG